MTKQRRRILEQEVAELTALLHEGPTLGELRAVLRRKKLDPRRCLLAGFVESEDGHEFGVLVQPDGTAVEYHRRVGSGTSPPRLLRWRVVDDPAALAASDYPALLVALEMVSSEARP